MTQQTLGFVGVGILGGPIVDRLLAAGIAVTAFDTQPQALARAGAAGASVAINLQEVAASSDLILVCVRTDDQCTEVVSGVLDHARAGSVIVLLATVHPDTASSLATTAAQRGVELVDAPLAGTGPEGVREGSMVALVGGDNVVINRLEPVLATFCSQVLRTGSVGSGAVVKLAHNVLIYLSYLAVVEAAGLARVSGVREGVLAEVTRATGALSTQAGLLLEIHDRRRLIEPGADPDADYFRGAAALLEKDLGHAIELAKLGGLHLPGAELTRQLGSLIYQIP